jgi:glycosyltransferase involved in cell wall biosynthesis
MLISLCIPTYSRVEYLKLAVTSCLNQTFEDFEICVSQDPKPDVPDNAITHWCKQMQESLPCGKFRYNLNKERLGLAGNWNKLVEMARGDYLIIIGDDDLLDNNFLTEMSNILGKERNEKLSVIFCNQFFINELGEILEETTKKLNTHYGRNKINEGMLSEPVKVVFNNSIPMSAALIRRDLLLKYPFDCRSNAPEFVVFLKIAIENGIFYYCDKQLASYRLHAQSATSSGLTVHYAVKNVIDTVVPAEYQSIKREYLSNHSMVVAVNMAFREGNKKLAWELITNKYYPLNKIHYRVIQILLMFIPKGIVKKFMNQI